MIDQKIEEINNGVRLYQERLLKGITSILKSSGKDLERSDVAAIKHVLNKYESDMEKIDVALYILKEAEHNLDEVILLLNRNKED